MALPTGNGGGGGGGGGGAGDADLGRLREGCWEGCGVD